MSSLSFPWKRIEERPENASTVRILIENVEKNKMDSLEELKQPEKLLEKFLEHFKLQDFFKINFSPVNAKNNKNNKKLSNKEQIILANELKNMSSDFEKFSLNKDKTLKRNKLLLVYFVVGSRSHFLFKKKRKSSTSGYSGHYIILQSSHDEKYY